jgi:hypothetical protein
MGSRDAGGRTKQRQNVRSYYVSYRCQLFSQLGTSNIRVVRLVAKRYRAAFGKVARDLWNLALLRLDFREAHWAACLQIFGKQISRASRRVRHEFLTQRGRAGLQGDNQCQRRAALRCPSERPASPSSLPAAKVTAHCKVRGGARSRHAAHGRVGSSFGMSPFIFPASCR